jgi:TusA-related sulfurtransferase
MKAIKQIKINQVLEILTTDPGSKTDIPTWVKATKHELISLEEFGPESFRFLVKRLR